MIIRTNPVTDTHLIQDLPPMVTSDGGDTWDWQCECGREHREEGAMSFDDVLVCEGCGMEYRNVEEI